MNTIILRIVLAFLLCLGCNTFVACGLDPGENQSGEVGEAEVGVAVDALSFADVRKVIVTVQGPGISPPRAADLSKVQGQWQGTLGAIPVGANRVFTAGAYDVADTLLYTGQATDVAISPGAPVTVVILLQQATPPTPFANSAPQILSLVTSTSQVDPGNPASFSVTATDPDDDPLSYAWTANGGTFTNADTATPLWTTLVGGDYTISIEVADGRGGKAGLSFPMMVAAKGSAKVTTSFNTWPSVTQVSATPGQLSPGGTTTLSVTAADADGDPLSYVWASACGGALSDPGVVSPVWTAPAPAPPSGTCTLMVTVSDGRGGTNSGSLLIGLNLPVTNLPPLVDDWFQSTATVDVGDTVSLGVAAHDPEGAALTFSWTASGGSLGAAATTAGSSDVVWTAAASGAFTITATVEDAGGATATQTFNVSSQPISAPPVITFLLPAEGAYVYIGGSLAISAAPTVDPDGDAIDYAGWDVTGDGAADITWQRSAPGQIPNLLLALTWAQMGAYPGLQNLGEHSVGLTVTDATGVSAFRATKLTVVEHALTAVAIVTPASGGCATTFHFDATASLCLIPNTTIGTYSWDFNSDGIFEKVGAQQNKVFGSFGSFTVTLKVKTVPGDQATTTVQVSTLAGNLPPVVQPGGPYFVDVLTMGGGTVLTLNASASTEPDAACGDHLVAYRWDLDNVVAGDGSRTWEKVSAQPTLGLVWSDIAMLPQNVAHPIVLEIEDSLGARTQAVSSLLISAP